MSETRRMRTMREIVTCRDRFRTARARGMHDLWDTESSVVAEPNQEEMARAFMHERKRFEKQNAAVAKTRAKLLGMSRKLKMTREKNLMLGAFKEQLEKERSARESDRIVGRQPAEALKSDRAFGRQPAEALKSDRAFGRQPADACKEANASSPKCASMKIEY